MPCVLLQRESSPVAQESVFFTCGFAVWSFAGFRGRAPITPVGRKGAPGSLRSACAPLGSTVRHRLRRRGPRPALPALAYRRVGCALPSGRPAGSQPFWSKSRPVLWRWSSPATHRLHEESGLTATPVHLGLNLVCYVILRRRVENLEWSLCWIAEDCTSLKNLANRQSRGQGPSCRLQNMAGISASFFLFKIIMYTVFCLHICLQARGGTRSHYGCL